MLTSEMELFLKMGGWCHISSTGLGCAFRITLFHSLITGFFHFVYESMCLSLLILKPPQAPNYPSFLSIISSPNFFKEQYTRRIKITVSNYLAFSMFQVLYKYYIHWHIKFSQQYKNKEGTILSSMYGFFKTRTQRT